MERSRVKILSSKRRALPTIVSRIKLLAFRVRRWFGGLWDGSDSRVIHIKDRRHESAVSTPPGGATRPGRSIRIRTIESRAAVTDADSSPPRRRPGFLRRRFSLRASRISVILGEKSCPACTLLLGGEEIARCNRDSDHVTHRSCVALLKQICPICKGTLI